MSELLFSIENELAFCVIDCTGKGAKSYLKKLIHFAGMEVPHLPDQSNSTGMYLANGSRLYIDAGEHPEISHAEATDPWTLVRLVLAGELILSRAANQVLNLPEVKEVILTRCNVDYSRLTTWGCHENYFYRNSNVDFRSRLVPFLVSRIIYTGAGGFDPYSRGPAFSLCPRASFIDHEVTSNSTSNRGIFHIKNEPFGQGNRMHIICGENLSSHTAMFLKSGITALVVAVLHADSSAAAELAICTPVEALRTFARDVTLTSKARLRSGRVMSALNIQRCYLDIVESHLSDSFMPEWAADVCREWRTILDRLSYGQEAVSETLDWAIKLNLYRAFAAERGFSWEALQAWANVHKTLSDALASLSFEGDKVSVELVLGRHSPVPETVDDLRPYMHHHKLAWGDLRRFVSMWHEMMEIESRFGILGEKGIFNRMDAARLLDHQIPGIENFEEMVLNPPPIGRARIRGECIKRLSPRKKEYLCDWQYIEHTSNGELDQYLDLSEPFESQERWTTPPPVDQSFESHADMLRSLLRLRRRRPHTLSGDD